MEEENATKRSRGRTAINIQHQNISTVQEEKRLNSKISEMYGVASDEAIDIHVNYHLDRIAAFLLKRAKENGMLKSMFYERFRDLNAIGYAYSIAQGELIEMAAVDILYNRLCNLHDSNHMMNDRYFNFYG